jgi:hypothetical protein
VLLWLYPTADLPVRDLLQFVREGGHLILADDIGTGEALFDAIGLTREPLGEGDGPSPEWATHGDVPGVPVFPVTGEHFLFFNVNQIVANHPSTLKGAGDVVLPVGSTGAGLIVEVPVGDGAVLAIGDPSLFLNEMLRKFHGNKQLAANVLRYYACEHGPCEIQLVLPETEVLGHYRSGLGRLGALPRVLDEAVMLVNGALRTVDAEIASAPGPLFLVLVVLLIAVALARSLLHMGGPVVEPTRRWPTPGVSPLRHDVAALLDGHDDADFSGPFNTLLADLAGGDVRRLMRMVAGQEGDVSGTAPDGEVREAVLRIRQQADSVQVTERGPVSAERFLSLLRDVRMVGQHLESASRGAPRWSEPPPSLSTRNQSHEDT